MLTPSSRCNQCPLFVRLRYHVCGCGPYEDIRTRFSSCTCENPKKAERVYIGEAPGANEVEEGRPFVGAAGRLFNELLQKASVKREEIRVTNTLKCQPLKNQLPMDLEQAIWCCEEILEKEVEEAKVVVGFGNVPLLALADEKNITRRRGSVHVSKWNSNIPFIPTLHPSYLMRQQHMTRSEMKDEKPIPKEVVAADIAKAEKIARGKRWKIDDILLTVAPTQTELDEFLCRLNKPEKKVGVDIETTREHPMNVIPLSIAFAFPDWGVYIEFDENLEFIDEALRSPTPKIFHNGTFDVLVLRNVGLNVTNWTGDTLYKHHLMYSELPHNLGFVQSLYTMLPYHKHMKDDWEEGLNK